MKKFFIVAGLLPVLTDKRPDKPYYTIKAWNKEAAQHVINENLKRMPSYYI